MSDATVTKDITQEVMEEARDHTIDVEIEVVISEQGEPELYVSWPRMGASKLTDYIDTLTELRDTAEKLVKRHGDAWWREEVQEKESRARMAARGALDAD